MRRIHSRRIFTVHTGAEESTFPDAILRMENQHKREMCYDTEEKTKENNHMVDRTVDGSCGDVVSASNSAGGRPESSGCAVHNGKVWSELSDRRRLEYIWKNVESYPECVFGCGGSESCKSGRIKIKCVGKGRSQWLPEKHQKTGSKVF